MWILLYKIIYAKFISFNLKKNYYSRVSRQSGIALQSFTEDWATMKIWKPEQQQAT